MGLFDTFHSVPVIGTICPGLESEVDEEIILEGTNMSPKSYVGEEMILYGQNLPLKENVPKVSTLANSAVSPFSSLTKVLPKTFLSQPQ